MWGRRFGRCEERGTVQHRPSASATRTGLVSVAHGCVQCQAMHVGGPINSMVKGVNEGSVCSCPGSPGKLQSVITSY